jgi:stearoyl-CoA desaturase (delta-9 desaturase)
MTTSMIVGIASLLLVLQVFAMANTIGFHRLLTHRSFKTRGWIRNALAFLGAQYSGSPMMWVGVHRVHHTISDWKDDPHTPRRGFWFAHSGWLIDATNPVVCAAFAASGFGLHLRFLYWDVLRVLGKRQDVWRKLTRDLEKEWLMVALDKPFVIPALFAAQVAGAWLVGGPWGIAWLWAFHTILNNSTWLVNSVCHWPTFGRAPHESKDDSRNVQGLAWLTWGESQHNGHHKYPKSARHGLLPGETDPSWAVIHWLERVGLAWDVHIPKQFRDGADAADDPEPLEHAA